MTLNKPLVYKPKFSFTEYLRCGLVLLRVFLCSLVLSKRALTATGPQVKAFQPSRPRSVLFDGGAVDAAAGALPGTGGF